MSTELLALLIVTDALFALLFLVALWGLTDIEREYENRPPDRLRKRGPYPPPNLVRKGERTNG